MGYLGLLAADPTMSEAMGALFNSGSFKGTLSTILVVVLVGALVGPTILKKLKTMGDGWLDERLKASPLNKVAVRFTAGQTEKQSEAIEAQAELPRRVLDVSALIKARAEELKLMCPNASSADRLKWLEDGFDVEQARNAYIGMLEKRLKEQNEPAPPSQPAAT